MEMLQLVWNADTRRLLFIRRKNSYDCQWCRGGDAASRAILFWSVE